VIVPMDEVQSYPDADSSKLPAGQDVTHVRDLSFQQWKSGIAAWLGWLFDGLDMHLYVLVAGPFVAELLGATDPKDPGIGCYGSLIQAAFLIGWALGGGFFGRIADRLGRSRALMLTILTYALFTGMSYFAQTWWQLLVCIWSAPAPPVVATTPYPLGQGYGASSPGEVTTKRGVNRLPITSFAGLTLKTTRQIRGRRIVEGRSGAHSRQQHPQRMHAWRHVQFSEQCNGLTKASGPTRPTASA
jgi:hypothetical protein